MLGTLIPHEKEVTVVGAGVNGLLIAYALKRAGFAVTVLEKSNRVGGVIETLDTPLGIVEKAAHSLLVSPEILGFLNDLGVEMLPVNQDAKARYIFRDGKMRRMPLRFFEIIKTLTRFLSRPKIALNFQTATLSDWCHVYLGRAAYEYLLSPFITGIFASSPSELNAKLAFPKLIPADPGLSLYRFFKQKPKSARPQMMAPRLGMQDLTTKLAKALGDSIELNVPLHSLPAARNLVLAVPTAELSKLIAKEDSDSAQKLLQVSYAPLITVTCFYPLSAFPKKPKGVGVLIPRGQGLRLLGCLFNSSSFENRVKDDQVSLTVMYGGTSDPSALDLNDETLSHLLHAELEKLLKVTKPATALHITRWPRAIPLYSNELKDARNQLVSQFCLQPGRVIFTNYSREVSIRSSIEAALHL